MAFSEWKQLCVRYSRGRERETAQELLSFPRCVCFFFPSSVGQFSLRRAKSVSSPFARAASSTITASPSCPQDPGESSTSSGSTVTQTIKCVCVFVIAHGYHTLQVRLCCLVIFNFAQTHTQKPQNFSTPLSRHRPLSDSTPGWHKLTLWFSIQL